MRKTLVASGFIVSVLVALCFLPVFAETAGRVTATVTPKLISIQVSPSGFDYGTLNLSGWKVSDACKATNNGNVAEDFKISGSNATSGQSGLWNLTTSSPTINNFRHSFVLDPYSGAFTPLELERIAFDSNISAGTDRNFKLKIEMPGSLDNQPYTQYSTVVDVVATEH